MKYILLKFDSGANLESHEAVPEEVAEDYNAFDAFLEERVEGDNSSFGLVTDEDIEKLYKNITVST